MAKIVLNFDTAGADQYKRIVGEAARQEANLNQELARTTVALAATAAVNDKVAQAYRNAVKAEREYRDAGQNFAKNVVADTATDDDLQAVAQKAEVYRKALADVGDEQKKAADSTKKHSDSQESLQSLLGLSYRSLSFLTRGLAEFGGASREITGLLTALGSITDIQSGLFVAAGLVMEEVAKRVREADTAYEQLSRRQALTAAESGDMSKFFQQQSEDADNLGNHLRQIPDLLLRISKARVDAVYKDPLMALLVNPKNLTEIPNWISQAQRDNQQSQTDAVDARAGAGQVAAAQEPQMRAQIILLAAEGASYDKLYQAVARYRQETFQAVEDKTAEAAATQRATQAWFEAGKALQAYHVILTAAEQAQIDFDDTVRSSAQSLSAAEKQNHELSSAMQALGINDQAAIGAVLDLAGAHAKEETAIKQLIPALMQEKLAKGQVIDTSAEGMQALHDEAAGLLRAQQAYQQYSEAVLAAAATQKQLQQLDTQHQKQLDDLAIQAERQAEDTTRSTERSKQDQAIAYGRQLADIEAGLARNREDAARSRNERLGDMDAEANRSREKSARDYADTREKIERDYNDNVARINQAYKDSLFDLETADDAKGLVRAKLQRDRGLRDAATARDKQGEDASRAYAKSQQEFEENLQHQKELLERDYQRQLENITREGQRQRDAAELQHSRQDEDFKRSLDRQAQDQALASQRRLSDLNRQYQEERGLLQQQLEYQKAQVQAAADAIKAAAKSAADEIGVQAGKAAADATNAAVEAGKQTAKLLDPAPWNKFFNGLSDAWNAFSKSIVHPPEQFPTNPDTGLNAGAAYSAASISAASSSVITPSVNGLAALSTQTGAISQPALNGQGGGEVVIMVHNNVDDPMLQSRIEVVASGVTAKVIKMAKASRGVR